MILQVLTEVKNRNEINKTKQKNKRQTTVIEVIDENIYPDSDDSNVEDDVERDPDWTQTPLYNRIQKLLVFHLCY